jgi:peptide chain release factor 1
VREQKSWRLNEKDLEVFTTKDSGPGGQHRNKTESCVVIRHKPTGIEAKAATKSQHDNRRVAREVLEARVANHYAGLAKSAEDSARKQMVGSGMRGDKIRTYRCQDDTVSDHESGQKMRLQKMMTGVLFG